jgi:hypothetical protein
MRLAFDIRSITPTSCTMAVYDGKGLLSGAIPVLLTWTRPSADAKAWDTNPSINISGLDGEGTTIARLLSNRVEAYCAAQKWPSLDNPLTLAHVLLAHGGSQVVYDKRLNKFRNVGLMKDGESKFELVGLDLEVEAEEEETAKRRGKKEVAQLMSDEPERAEALAKWFTGGCKVKKSVDAKMPDHHGVVQLAANNPVEKARALEPVARRRGKDTGEE